METIGQAINGIMNTAIPAFYIPWWAAGAIIVVVIVVLLYWLYKSLIIVN